MRIVRWLAVLMVTVLLPAEGLSATPQEQIKQIDQLFAEGQPGAAYDALDTLIEHYWQSGPMVVRKAVYASEITGYGRYTEHAPVFTSNEPHVIYVEPAGYGFGNGSDGQLEAGWTVDFSLTNDKDAVLLRQADFVTLTRTLGAKSREVYFSMTVNLSGLKPGRYVSHYILKDRYSDKTAEFEMAFDVTE